MTFHGTSFKFFKSAIRVHVPAGWPLQTLGVSDTHSSTCSEHSSASLSTTIPAQEGRKGERRGRGGRKKAVVLTCQYISQPTSDTHITYKPTMKCRVKKYAMISCPNWHISKPTTNTNYQMVQETQKNSTPAHGNPKRARCHPITPTDSPFSLFDHSE